MNALPSNHRMRGFTLIELMISMVLGLIVMLALIVVLVNFNRNSDEMSKSNGIIENGRYAMQLLAADLSHTGYWGGHVPEYDNLAYTGVPTDVPSTIPDPCLDYNTPWSAAYKSALVGIGVQVYGIPDDLSGYTPSICSAKILNPQADTDILVVRHAESCVPGVGSCPDESANELFFQVARCGTSVSLSPAYALDHNPMNLILQNRDCATTADKRRFVSNVYYIRNYANTPGDGIPTLMRSQFGVVNGVPTQLDASPLIEGIEGFHIELGVDTISDSGAAVDLASSITWADATTQTSPTNRGDGIPDGDYVSCTDATPCTLAQLINTVAIKIHLLVRSDKTTPGYIDTKTYALGSKTMAGGNDGYKRHVFSQTLRLSNISGRRETP